MRQLQTAVSSHPLKIGHMIIWTYSLGTAPTGQSKDKDETEQHTETRVEEQPSRHDEGEMEQEGFEEVICGWNHRRRWQQVIIRTSRDIEIKAENKKAWIYLRRMTQDTTIGVWSFLIRKGIKGAVIVEELRRMGSNKAFKLGFLFEYLRLTETPEFWPQGAIIRPFRISYRTGRQHRGASVDTDM